MSFCDLIIQEYPSGVYQPGITSPDPKICLIQPSLDISDSSFASSELLNLEIPLHPSGSPVNITILDDHISSITYISQVPSTSPINDQFPLDACQKLFMVVIDN